MNNNKPQKTPSKKKKSIFIHAAVYREKCEIGGNPTSIGQALANVVTNTSESSEKVGSKCITSIHSEHLPETSLLLLLLRNALSYYCRDTGYAVTFSPCGIGSGTIVTGFETGELKEFAENGHLKNEDGEEYKLDFYLSKNEETIRDIFKILNEHQVDLRIVMAPALCRPQLVEVTRRVKNRIGHLQSNNA